MNFPRIGHFHLGPCSDKQYNSKDEKGPGASLCGVLGKELSGMSNLFS